MTDEQINAAIAEVCGWTECRLVAKVVLSVLRDPVAYGVPPNRTYEIACPNYCADLNAMHEAERIIADKGVNAWWIYCGNIVRLMPSIFGNETAVMATARQRAEAFLRTLGKWEEGE